MSLLSRGFLRVPANIVRQATTASFTRAKSSVAVIGGAGQLGASIVDAFREKGWAVTSIDIAPNDAAERSVVLKEQSLVGAANEALKQLEDQQFKAIICVAGGWEGDGDGGPASPTFVQSVDNMLRVNLNSAVNAAQLAAAGLLEPGGMLTLTGAVGALGPSPGMLGYGMAKAATHHLVKSLAFEDGIVAGFGGVAFPCHINAILPGVLDTESNRQGMPDADVSDWTPLSHVADELVKWAGDDQTRPANGSLVKIATNAGTTTFEEV